jgi:succinate-semialdehyde dehydrogenase/glutarate-semialdehyde dehydrogenase
MNMIAEKFPAGALIDGQWITSAKTFSVNDPATGAEVATVPDLGAKDAACAIDAAARALPAWSAKTAKERAAILRRWFDLITAETESLAQLMTTEQGKPLSESRAEVAYGASFIEWFAE